MYAGTLFHTDYILITAYSEDRKNLGSLMVFDRESGEYLVTLGMKKKVILAVLLLMARMSGSAIQIPIP